MGADLGGSTDCQLCARASDDMTYHKDVAERLQIISSRLLDTQMGVDGRVPSGTSQVLVLSVRDMEVRLGVSVLLGQTEIDDVDLVASLSNTHEEVVWFDVSVDEVSRVNVLDSGDELIGEQKDGLERELSVAEVEQVFERWAAADVSCFPAVCEGLSAYSRSKTIAL